MGVWTAHSSIGNILGSLVAGAFVEIAWGWSFVIPGLIIGLLSLPIYLFLVPCKFTLFFNTRFEPLCDVFYCWKLATHFGNIDTIVVERVNSVNANWSDWVNPTTLCVHNSKRQSLTCDCSKIHLTEECYCWCIDFLFSNYYLHLNINLAEFILGLWLISVRSKNLSDSYINIYSCCWIYYNHITFLIINQFVTKHCVVVG